MDFILPRPGCCPVWRGLLSEILAQGRVDAQLATSRMCGIEVAVHDQRLARELETDTTFQCDCAVG